MPSSRVLTFSDPYEYAQSARGAHVKTFVTTRGAFVGTTVPISLHRLWMNRTETSLPHIKHVALDGRRSGISFLADYDQPSEYLRGTELSSGEIAWSSCSAEFHRRIPAGSRWATMSLVPEDLAAAGRALTGREPAAPRAAHVTRPPPALMSRLMNLHRAASDFAATAPDILGHPEVAKAMEQELVRTMVACLTAAETGAGSRSCRLGGAVMRRFEQLLEAHPNEPLYITEICARIGVTDRALRMYCQEHLGMSPHRYLWLRRMHLARRALALADARVETVTEIANLWVRGARALRGVLPTSVRRNPLRDPAPVRLTFPRSSGLGIFRCPAGTRRTRCQAMTGFSVIDRRPPKLLPGVPQDQGSAGFQFTFWNSRRVTGAEGTVFFTISRSRLRNRSAWSGGHSVSRVRAMRDASSAIRYRPCSASDRRLWFARLVALAVRTHDIARQPV
jgi:AraC-like DNA-binding protein